MILTRDAKNVFYGQNLRGQAMTPDQFETRHINLAASGQQIHAFIVAPFTCYQGQNNADARPSRGSYKAYGVYAIDETTFTEWQKAQRQKLQKVFNASGNKTPFSAGFEVLPTLSEADKIAKALNEAAYENHIKDFQEGKLSGVTAWAKKDRHLISRPARQESFLAG